MALDPNDLAQDILNDSQIMGDVPTEAQAKMQQVWTQLSVHITKQIQRAIVEDVQVDEAGNQTNQASVK